MKHQINLFLFSICYFAVPECVQFLEGLDQCVAGWWWYQHGLLDLRQCVLQTSDLPIHFFWCAVRDPVVGQMFQKHREVLKLCVHSKDAGRASRALWETVAVAAFAGITASTCNARLTATQTCEFITAAWLCARWVTVTCWERKTVLLMILNEYWFNFCLVWNTYFDSH